MTPCTDINFPRHDRQNPEDSTLPAELIGFWRIGTNRHEIRNTDRYYVHDLDVPYELADAGMTLVHGGTRYLRRFGDPAGLPGVWTLEADPTEEWNLRPDGSYTFHWPGFEYFGDYTFNNDTVSTAEMRAVLTEASGVLTFDPPYMPAISGTWTLVEPDLTVEFPSGPIVFTRE